MKNTILVAAALIILAGTGWVHGRWTNRWRPTPELAKIAGQLQSLPETIGDWRLELTREIPPRELAMTGAVGNVSRVYTNNAKGQSVSILVLTGLPGDISTHTPDVCYPGAGYVLGAAEDYTRSYGDHKAGFRTATASKGGASPSFLRIFWAWRGSKGWSAPESARWAFAAEPLLTKLYVVRDTRGAISDPREDPCNDFIPPLLAELDRILTLQSMSPQATVAQRAL
jgi:hypothetical protein